MRHTYLWFCLLLLTPKISLAAVLINEIAWMGDTASANNEWIELYNDGAEDVNVSGWTLSFGATTVTIGVGKIIRSGQYVLLERNRSSGNYLSSGEPFWIYTGALANTGALLVLRDADGNERHRADGLDSWSIGGDNSTKATAQLTASGWITALPTPLAANTNPPQVVEPPLRGGSGASQNQQAVLRGATTTERIHQNALLLATELAVEIAADDIAFVGGEIEFARNVAGMPETILQSLKYEWNFGDGFVKNPAEKVKHIYREPGNYIVTVRASYQHYEAFARHNVVVLPIVLSLERQSDGRLSVHNDSGYEIDISGYQIVAPDRIFTMPPYTLMSARGTITLPAAILNVRANQNVWLRDRQGRVVSNMVHGGAVAAAVGTAAMPQVTAATAPTQSSLSASRNNPNFRFAGEPQNEILEITEEMMEVREAVDIFEEDLADDGETANNAWAQYVFWIFLVLLAAAVFVSEKWSAKNRE